MIYQELEEGVQDPEGAWGWLSKKRGDLNSLGRNLTNSEIYDYFIKCKIVADYRLFSVIRTHCLTVDFVEDLEELKWGSPKKEVRRTIKYLRRYGKRRFEEKEIWVCRNL